MTEELPHADSEMSLTDATRCPVCGWRSKIVMSRLRRGKYFRRRECLGATCKHRWTTVEVRMHAK